MRTLWNVKYDNETPLASPTGKSLDASAVLLGVAEMEQEARRERQAAGIAVAKERGVYQGRQSGTTKANPSRAQQLKQRGLSLREIAAALDVSTRTARRYLIACP